MNFEDFLSRFDRVRMIGTDRATALCPGHPDKTPSVSIRVTEDGKILIHDFGGCPVTRILDAIGLTLADLFPERPAHSKSTKPGHWHAMREALKALSAEVMIVVLAADVLSKNEKLTDVDRERLLLAATRIRSAGEYCL